jgi:hypothetical protein
MVMSKKLWACEGRDTCNIRDDTCNYWFDRTRKHFKEDCMCDPEEIVVACRAHGDDFPVYYFNMEERRYDGNTEIKKDADEVVPEVRYNFGY